VKVNPRVQRHLQVIWLYSIPMILVLVVLVSACGQDNKANVPSNPSQSTSASTSVATSVIEDKSAQLPSEMLNMKLPAEPDSLPPHTVAKPATLRRPATPINPGSMIASMPSAESVNQKVTPEAPATISLSDGMKVQIPAGALKTDTAITVARLKSSGPEAKSSTVYRIGSEDIKLNTQATLEFPFDSKSVPQDGDVRVAYLNGANGWTEVSVDVDRNAGKAAVKTDHFSTWLIFWTGQWSGEYKPSRPPVTLNVPYYYQGSSSWCWAASLQGLLKYYGRDWETWKIAETFGNDYDSGLMNGEIAIGHVADFLQAQGFEDERTLLGWFDFNELTGYLMYQISQGRPVWLGCNGMSHAILAVGFNSQGLLINDPSGYAVEFLRGANSVDDARLNPVLITYQEWYKICFWNPKMPGWNPLNWDMKGMAAVFSTVVKNASPAQTPAITMSVLNDNIEFQIPRPKNYTYDFYNTFKWDGTKRNGHTFAGLHPGLAGLPVNNPGNSDTLTKFVVNLANSTEKAVKASLALLIDGKPLAEKKNIDIPSHNSNTQVDLMAGAPYPFKNNPLKLGYHNFQMSLSVDGQVLDMCTIEFTMGPAQPTNLKLARSDNQINLTWDQGLEVQKNLDQLFYVIWKDNGNYKTVVDPTFKDILSQSDTTPHNYRVEAISQTDFTLTSIVSEKVQDVKIIIPSETPLEIKLHQSYFPGTKQLEEEYYYYQRAGSSTEIKHGVQKMYYVTGDVYRIGNWKDGKEDGVQTWYFQDGKVLHVYTMKNGISDGPEKEYYITGKIKFEAVYKDGKTVPGTLKRYDEEGNITDTY
jgi:hypothetical protein